MEVLINQAWNYEDIAVRKTFDANYGTKMFYFELVCSWIGNRDTKLS